MYKDRNKEAQFNPHEYDVGPYDKNIEKYIQVIKTEFENFNEIKFYCKLLRKCLLYNPQKRPDFLKLKKSILKIEEKYTILKKFQDINNEIMKLKEQNFLFDKEILIKNKEINDLKIKLGKFFKFEKTSSLFI